MEGGQRERRSAPLASAHEAAAIRELLAMRIIEMAQVGERDPNQLRADALLYLTRTNLQSTGLMFGRSHDIAADEQTELD